MHFFLDFPNDCLLILGQCHHGSAYPTLFRHICFPVRVWIHHAVGMHMPKCINPTFLGSSEHTLQVHSICALFTPKNESKRLEWIGCVEVIWSMLLFIKTTALQLLHCLEPWTVLLCTSPGQQILQALSNLLHYSSTFTSRRFFFPPRY